MFAFSVYNSASVLRTPSQPRRSREKFVRRQSVLSSGVRINKSSKQQKYVNVACKVLKSEGVTQQTTELTEMQPIATKLQPTVCNEHDDKSNEFFLPAGLLAAVLLYQTDPAFAETLAFLPAAPSELSLTAILASLEQLGDAGAVLLLFVVTIAEMVPLVPTQPLAIASGLLFGWEEGIPLALAGTTLAALFAFLISRNLGDRFVAFTEGASSMGVKGELSELEGDGMQKQLSKISSLVEAGTQLECALKVMVLRFSPVVPYSVSNYLMGLTKVPVAPFVFGTAVGMAPWMAFYASVGSTGRSLMMSGKGFDDVMQDLLEQAEGAAAGPISVLLFVTVIGAIYAVAKNKDDSVSAS